MRYALIFTIAMLTYGTTLAQGEFSGGFKAGLNFNRIDGPTEANEVFDSGTGFHIGATFVYSFTDLFGVKGELMYSQKGGQYVYEGDSYFTFYTTDTQTPIYANGQRRSDLSISNAYIDIPVLLYYKIGKLELEAGPSVGFQAGSRATGGITFSGTTQAGSPVEEFTTNVDYSYYSSERAADALIQANPVILNTLQASEPASINAYYEAADNDDNKYRTIDLGLNAGLAFFLNKGLYVGVRANYGLMDITNEGQDISPVALDFSQGGSSPYVTRNDEDRNISIQASVGFRF